MEVPHSSQPVDLFLFNKQIYNYSFDMGLVLCKFYKFIILTGLLKISSLNSMWFIGMHNNVGFVAFKMYEWCFILKLHCDSNKAHIYIQFYVQDWASYLSHLYAI